jgi:hypothetical protein
MRRRVQDVKAYTFSFLWTIFSVILLSLIPEKKARYLLPVLIPMAMNTSFYIEYLISNFKNIRNKLERAIVYFTFGLIALIAFAIPFAVFFLFKSKLNGYIFWYIILAIISLYCSYVIAKNLYRKKFAQVFYTTVLFMCGTVITVIPLSKMYYNNTRYYAAFDIHGIEKKFNIKTYEGDEFVPEITWDYGNYIPILKMEKPLQCP